MTGYGAGTTPLAVAHRGGAGLGPENSFDTFDRTLALGLTHLEIDVRVTRDGVPVLFHDPTLAHLTGSRARVADLTLEELDDALPDGVAVPTLSDALSAYESVNFMVDLKDPSDMHPVLDVLEYYGAASRVCLTGAWEHQMRIAHGRLGEGLSTALGWGRMARLLLGARFGLPVRFGTVAAFAHVPLRCWNRYPGYTARVVGAAHDLGLRLVVWGVDDSATMHRLLDDGVDGVITDRPDTLREVLISRGEWTPWNQLPVPVR